MDNKHMKRWPTSLVTRKMQIKMTVRCHSSEWLKFIKIVPKFMRMLSNQKINIAGGNVE